MSKNFICKGCGETFEKNMESSTPNYCYICNEFYMKQKIAQLEHRLSNCIEPKFKIGQEVWFVKYFNAGCYEFAYGKVIEIKITEYDGIFYEMEYRNNYEIDFRSRHEKYVFATEEEAKEKLKGMRDEKV